MMTVTVVYPNDERVENVILARVPNVGEDIRLRKMKPSDPSLVVEHVLMSEGEDAIVMVRERPNGRR